MLMDAPGASKPDLRFLPKPRPLTSRQRSALDVCLGVIREGPSTVEAIGEALWRVQADRLYRDQFANMEAFLSTVAKVDPNVGYEIINAWKITPRGQEVRNERPLKDCRKAVAIGKLPVPNLVASPTPALVGAKRRTADEDRNPSFETFKAPDAKTLQKLPELQREAEMATLAQELNRVHAEIEAGSEAFLRAGAAIIKKAIACGNCLRTIKAVLKHGSFENWCVQSLAFKIRTAQYYMLLAHRHAARDILKLKPQSLRQALIYAGALPEDTEKAHPSGEFDELAHVRKTIARLLLELKASEDNYREALLKAIEPLIEWRDKSVAKGNTKEEPGIVVDIEARVDLGK